MVDLPDALAARADTVDPSGIAAEAVARRLEYRRGRGGKWCPVCATQKELHEFGKDATRADGLTSVCRQCRRAFVSPPVPFTIE